MKFMESRLDYQIESRVGYQMQSRVDNQMESFPGCAHVLETERPLDSQRMFPPPGLLDLAGKPSSLFGYATLTITQAEAYRCHKLSLQLIELAITSVSQSARESESQHARDHGQNAVVTPQVNLSSFLSRFSRHLIDFIPRYRQLAVRVVVSATAVFRLVDNLCVSIFIFFFRLFTVTLT